jgi:hypothetical protein
LHFLKWLNNGCVLLVDENEGQAAVIEITVVYARVRVEVLPVLVVLGGARGGRRQEAAAVRKGVDVEAVLNILVFWFNFLGINVKDTEDLFRNN